MLGIYCFWLETLFQIFHLFLFDNPKFPTTNFNCDLLTLNFSQNELERFKTSLLLWTLFEINVLSILCCPVSMKSLYEIYCLWKNLSMQYIFKDIKGVFKILKYKFF